MRLFWMNLIVLVGGFWSHAQGFVAFGNRNTLAGIDAPVYDVDCRTRLAGPAYVAQLYFGSTPGSLEPVGPVLSFRAGAAAGYLPNTPVSIPGHPEYTPVWVQIRAWEAAAGGSYEAAVAKGGNMVFRIRLKSSLLPRPPPQPTSSAFKASVWYRNRRRGRCWRWAWRFG